MNKIQKLNVPNVKAKLPLRVERIIRSLEGFKIEPRDIKRLVAGALVAVTLAATSCPEPKIIYVEKEPENKTEQETTPPSTTPEPETPPPPPIVEEEQEEEETEPELTDEDLKAIIVGYINECVYGTCDHRFTEYTADFAFPGAPAMGSTYVRWNAHETLLAHGRHINSMISENSAFENKAVFYMGNTIIDSNGFPGRPVGIKTYVRDDKDDGYLQAWGSVFAPNPASGAMNAVFVGVPSNTQQDARQDFKITDEMGRVIDTYEY